MPSRILTLDHHAFDNALTDEAAAYWAGFLAADGWILRRENRAAAIGLCLSAKDADHFHEFVRFVKCDAKIRDKKATGFGINSPHRQLQIEFCSDHMADTLATFGIVPRKSLTAKFSLLTHIPAFWRGVICGDGTVSYKMIEGYRYPYIALTGSLNTLAQFVEFCSANGVAKWTKFWQRPKSKAWYTSLTGTKAMTVIRCLFQGATVGMPRKVAAANEILANCKIEPRTDHSNWTPEFLSSGLARFGKWTKFAKHLGVPVGRISKRRQNIGLIK